jgi:hypothetical protein
MAEPRAGGEGGILVLDTKPLDLSSACPEDAIIHLEVIPATPICRFEHERLALRQAAPE